VVELDAGVPEHPGIQLAGRLHQHLLLVPYRLHADTLGGPGDQSEVGDPDPDGGGQLRRAGAGAS
jgi:hypothetical protein